MKLKYILIFILVNFSFSQAKLQDKYFRASMVYGYFTGIEYGLENISKFKPHFVSKVNNLNLLYRTNFRESKLNSIEYLKKNSNWEELIKPEIDSIKVEIEASIIFSTNEDAETYLNELERKLKGDIPSPLLENILSFQYEKNPHKEFSEGHTYNYNTKGHLKAKNTCFSLDIPKSWVANEGKQPNVIQVFNSDCGNGLNTVSLMTIELPIAKEEFGNLSFDEIDKFYKEEFNEDYAREISDGKFINFNPMTIAGRAGFSVLSENITEKIGIKMKFIQCSFIFHDLTHLHIINCSIGTGDINENLSEKFKFFNPLFNMIVNSVVIQKNNNDSNQIALKGSHNQKNVQININGKDYEFILDTGASISLINKSIINNLLNQGIISKRNFIGKDLVQTADGKKHLVEFWNVPKIKIGKNEIIDVDFIVMDGGNIKPLLGMNILNKMNIYKIDLENNIIYLKN